MKKNISLYIFSYIIIIKILNLLFVFLYLFKYIILIKFRAKRFFYARLLFLFGIKYL